MAIRTIYAPRLVAVEDTFRENWGIAVNEQGRVERAAPRAELPTDHPEIEFHRFPTCVLVPGTVNVHNHSYQSLGRGLADDRSFDDWCEQGIYWLSEQLKPEDIYTGALLAFGEMLQCGVTAVCDFFYLHHKSNQPARTIIQAAQDLGIRLHLARTMYDAEGAPEIYRETVQNASERTHQLIRDYRDHPMVSVSPAPHSPHAASPDMIRAGYNLAEQTNSRMHIHVAEVESEVDMTRREYGTTPLRYLDQLGVVDERTVAVHCVNLEDEEIRMMGERGAHLAYCPSSNMFLGDGITDIPAFLEAGVTVGLGTDGGCSNNRVSVLEEMRMTGLLQKANRKDGTVVPADTTWRMGTSWGAEILQYEGGKVSEGAVADFLLIDLDDLSMQPRIDLNKNLVYSVQPTAIESVVVNGHVVVRDGKLTRFSGEEIRERVESLTARLTSQRRG